MQKLTLDNFISRANCIHNFYFDYSKSILINIKTKIIIKCPIHGDFLQLPKTHLRGRNGCALCTGKSALNIKQFIYKSNLCHKNKYDYSLVNYINNNSSVNIICPLHGKFSQSPTHHMQGNGCKSCAKNVSLTFNSFKIKANNIHNNKYLYEDINKIRTYSYVNINCPNHGLFSQRVSSHLSGSGCPKCAGKNITISEFIQKAKLIHNYDYSLVNYTNATTPIIIICQKHGQFNQTPNAHLAGKGCLKCSISVSKKELRWLKSLKINLQYQYVIVHNNNKYKVDAFDSETNTIYEFYGDFWHGNPAVYDLNKINHMNGKSFQELNFSTVNRELILNQLGYNIVSIWENDFKG